eukprot:3521347-Amphidinium_carterae.2
MFSCQLSIQVEQTTEANAGPIVGLSRVLSFFPRTSEPNKPHEASTSCRGQKLGLCHACRFKCGSATDIAHVPESICED